MDSTGESAEAERKPHQTIPTRLSSLKQEGSALLVVGNLAPEQYRHACHRMLGDDATATRRRILVTTNQSASSPTARLPPTARQPQTDEATHIAYTTRSRSAAVKTASATNSLPTEYIEDPDLSTLGITISEAIHEFQQGTSELAPAELRVCFDSLRPLLSEHDTEQVFQFLHLLTGRIRDVRGMGHFHLPVTSDSKSVRILTPLFDALVELRSNDETFQQRWRFPDEDLQSSWLSL